MYNDASLLIISLYNLIARNQLNIQTYSRCFNKTSKPDIAIGHSFGGMICKINLGCDFFLSDSFIFYTLGMILFFKGLYNDATDHWLVMSYNFFRL